MSDEFRQRSAAALTHPATLVALAAMIVNDLVLKALFPGAWAVGKISDLAWVVFASPLLAFILSFAVPKSAGWRRAALVAAYVGLPSLYAAFNTFAPVHDAIIRALLIASDGAAVGSPMDATDSLVIPIGLAVAAWVWRRGAKSAGGSRSRFALIIAAIAALASVASTPSPIVLGVTELGILDDGSISAMAGYNESSSFNYNSQDGGMSWTREDSGMREIAILSSTRAQTPRGEFSITFSGIERLDEDGQGEIVYSTEYLRGDANRWMQDKDTDFDGLYKDLARRPTHIIYHPDSGNLIASMGIQGVVVGTPDGRWHRVAVGPYSPTDFSFSAKTRALLDSGWLVGGIALALSLSAIAVAAAATAYEYKDYKQDRESDSLFILLAALGCLGAVWAVYAAGWPAAVVLLTSLIAMTVAVSKSSYDDGKWRFAFLGCLSALALSVALTLRFGLVSENTGADFVLFSDSEINVALAFAALASLIFPLAYHIWFIERHWLAFALAFVGIAALIALAFALWLQLNLSLPATQAAIFVLVGLAAVVLVRHVRATR